MRSYHIWWEIETLDDFFFADSLLKKKTKQNKKGLV